MLVAAWQTGMFWLPLDTPLFLNTRRILFKLSGKLYFPLNELFLGLVR
jgi:hypothetical protein